MEFTTVEQHLQSCLLVFQSRSSHPPLYPVFLHGFFLLGVIGFLVQILGYAGLQYASAALASSILHLISGFTFILAVLLRMEIFNYRSISTQAKTTGTVISILGALVATLYQGTALITRSPSSLTSNLPLLKQSSASVIGGTIFIIDCMFAAGFIISQAFTLKKYPVEMLLMLFYSFSVAILSAGSSFIVDKELSAWSLNTRQRLLPVIFSGFFGNVFQVTITSWCIRKRGPVFVSVFHPISVVVSTVTGFLFLGETFYLGSLVGSVIVISGFYMVIWGKAKEWKAAEKGGIAPVEERSQKIPLLQDREVGV